MTRPTTLAGWLAYLETLHPKSIALGLDRVREVAARLPLALDCPVITVSGTNGKGSTCAMLEAILSAAGYRVGSYTSPHLRRYNERVRIGRDFVTDGDLLTAFDVIEDARVGGAGGAETPLTYFEFGTLAALWLFARGKFDVLVLEVGLGGRLDAVNLIDADVAVVTSIDLDHMDYLGPTREDIAREKSGHFSAVSTGRLRRARSANNAHRGRERTRRTAAPCRPRVRFRRRGHAVAVSWPERRALWFAGTRSTRCVPIRERGRCVDGARRVARSSPGAHGRDSRRTRVGSNCPADFKCSPGVRRSCSTLRTTRTLRAPSLHRSEQWDFIRKRSPSSECTRTRTSVPSSTHEKPSRPLVCRWIAGRARRAVADDRRKASGGRRCASGDSRVRFGRFRVSRGMRCCIRR
jgi:hypothetical protein